MTDELSIFWTVSVVVALAALLVLRKRSVWAVLVVPATALTPLMLSVSRGPDGPRFGGVDDWQVYGATAVVLAGNVIGLVLGRFGIVRYVPYLGRVVDSTEEREEREDPAPD